MIVIKKQGDLMEVIKKQGDLIVVNTLGMNLVFCKQKLMGLIIKRGDKVLRYFIPMTPNEEKCVHNEMRDVITRVADRDVLIKMYVTALRNTLGVINA